MDFYKVPIGFGMELSSTNPDVKFENIHFADSLLILSYRIANR